MPPFVAKSIVVGAAENLWHGPAGLRTALAGEWRLVTIRWVGILIMMPSVVLLQLPVQRVVSAYAVLGVAAIYNLFIQIALKRHPALFTNGYLTTLGDTLLNVAMVFLGGGFGTPFYFLLYSVTIASAMRKGYGPTAAMTLCIVGFDLAERRTSGLGLDGAFLMRSGFLVLTGHLASYLRQQARWAQAALHVQLQQATHASLHDRLTGLANGTLFTQRIEQELREALLTSTPVAVLVFELDRFKEVNDTFGHRYGDLLLQETAERLANALPRSAMVARLSGDEFAIVLPGANADIASQAAEHVLRTVEQPVQLDEVSVDVSASIGIAVAPEHGTDAELLQRHADVAMYVARSRRADYALYFPEQDMHSRERLELAADLRRAVERGELRLHYQPIVSLHTGRIEEAEALVRWQHPTRGLVSPGQFIPLAEETGMIVPLGRWVLEEACRQAVAWGARYPAARSLMMSVNLSARHFQYGDVPSDVTAVLERTGLDPKWLKLEITESVAMTDPELSIAALWLLKGMGVHLAIDDFGTGYSSLGYLKRFPVDTLKIDKVFIDGLGVHPEDAAIVAATIAFAHAVGLSTTAEGVEHADQLAHVRELGVDRVQGYYCSKPLPADSFADLLGSGWSLAGHQLEMVKAA
jgi:diguanylate cyclase (GGDEF)-like protein